MAIFSEATLLNIPAWIGYYCNLLTDSPVDLVEILDEKPDDPEFVDAIGIHQ